MIDNDRRRDHSEGLFTRSASVGTDIDRLILLHFVEL